LSETTGRRPWVTLALLGAGLLATAVPGGGEALQYDRERVAAGEVGRLITGSFTHWTARMALWDLLFVGVAGAWIERRSRARLVVASLLGLVATGAAVHLLAPEIDLYRGSSGLATALFLAAAVDGLLVAGSRLGRTLAAGAIVLLLAKIVFETAVRPGVAAGPLPAGVRVIPLAHGAGVAAGAAAVALFVVAGRLRRPCG